MNFLRIIDTSLTLLAYDVNVWSIHLYCGQLGIQDLIYRKLSTFKMAWELEHTLWSSMVATSMPLPVTATYLHIWKWMDHLLLLMDHPDSAEILPIQPASWNRQLNIRVNGTLSSWPACTKKYMLLTCMELMNSHPIVRVYRIHLSWAIPIENFKWLLQVTYFQHLNRTFTTRFSFQ